jgi:4-hydroxy-tetrahydrodipicolinate synthase
MRGGMLDLDAVGRLVRHLQRQQVDGLVLCGTTGEAATLSADEQQALLRAVRKATAGALPIVFGLAGSDTAALCRTTRRFEGQDLAGLMVSAPAYTRPSQAGIQRHFEAIAAATNLPIVLYNIPYRTGIEIELGTCQTLARNPQFAAIKQSAGPDCARMSALIETTPLQVLCGEDSFVFSAACLGAHGAIAASAHFRPELWRAMLAYIANGQLTEARRLNRVLVALAQLLFSEPNPAPIKSALAMQGLIEDDVRLPLLAGSKALRTRLARELPALLAWQAECAPA